MTNSFVLSRGYYFDKRKDKINCKPPEEKQESTHQFCPARWNLEDLLEKVERVIDSGFKFLKFWPLTL